MPARKRSPVKKAVRKTAPKPKAVKPSKAKTPAAKRPAAKRPAPDAPRPFAAAFTRAPGERRHWLVKSEPESFSWDDLEASPGRTTCWDGVRNYQARNFMRDGMRAGDLVLFYHSNAEPPAAVGVCEVVREAYPDHTAFDPSDPHHDPASREDAPTWMMVDLRAVERFAVPVSLPMLRDAAGLEGLELLRRGSRLSVQPVEAAHWEIIIGLGRG